MKPYSMDLRIRVIEAYNRKEGSIRELGMRFGVHWRTVSNWLTRLKKEGSVGPRPPSRGPKTKLDEKGHDSLRELVDQRPDATRRELAEELQLALGVELSAMGVGRALRRLRMTNKQKSRSASERDRPDVWEALEEFADAVTPIAAERLVFIDETGVHLAMSRTHGWAPVGERLLVEEPLRRGQNVTIIGALSLDGMLTEMMLPGAADKEAFRVFIHDLLIPRLYEGQVVVLDNLKVHHDPKIEEMLSKVGVSVLFLPPYHPELDPIENAWSKLKSRLRSAKARVYDALVHAVRDAIQIITPQDAQGWFDHCGYSEA